MIGIGESQWRKILVFIEWMAKWSYSKTCNMRRTKSQNINVSRLVLQLTLPNPLKPGVKSRMKI